MKFSFMIRQAIKSDIPVLAQLREQYSFTTQMQNNLGKMRELKTRGFLNGNYIAEEFESDLNKLFLVWEDGGLAKAYIRIDELPDLDFVVLNGEDQVVWLNPNLGKTYFQTPHAEIGAILVSDDIQGKGIGSLLLAEAEKQLIAKEFTTLFSFVVDRPVFNEPSKNFHLKHGFVPVARLKLQREFYGYRNYQSTLYCKKLIT